MADVTISSLPTRTPSGNNILPYSTGSNTLGTPVSALFQSVGNIGIGTTSPSYLLDLRQNYNGALVNIEGSSDNIAIRLKNNQTGGREYRIISTAQGSGYGTGALALEDQTSGSARMVINNAGNVGIGTSTPQAKLEVVGDVKASNTPKAWASFNGKAAIGTNQPIRASYNITSILRTDDNLYQVTFPAGVFSNTDYAFFGTSCSSLNRTSILSGPLISAPTATTFKFGTFSLVYTGQPAGWIGESAEYISIAFFAL